MLTENRVTPFDPYGYSPELVQSGYGWPLETGVSATYETRNVFSGLTFLQEAPYRPYPDFLGEQASGNLPIAYHYADLYGYRGILPLSIQPQLNNPEPWQFGYGINEVP
jgi:hypothetical protein